MTSRRYPAVRLEEGLWPSESIVSPDELERLRQRSSDMALPETSSRERPADVAFFAAGVPAPQGNKRAFRNKHSGKIAMVETSKRAPTWRSDIRDTAEKTMAGRYPLDGPLEVELRFVFPRPQMHLSAKGGLKDSAPVHLAQGPDVDKLARGVLDALAVRSGGCVITDDRCVTRLVASKEYGERPGCHVSVRRLA